MFTFQLVITLISDLFCRRVFECLSNILEHDLAGLNISLGLLATICFCVWIAWKLSGYEYALRAGASMLRIPNMVFVGVDERVILGAQDLVERHRLRPKDAIHVSTATLVGEREMVSDDADFDGVKDVERTPL